MLLVFSPIFVVDTKIFRYDFVAPLTELKNICCKLKIYEINYSKS